MPFEPEFMKRFKEFSIDKTKIKTVSDWFEFENKWLNEDEWPEKSKSQLIDESLKKKGPFKKAGRLWGYSDFIYDITPESRYEYFKVVREIGDPLKFPDEIDMPKTRENGFFQECPYCEINTDEIGDSTCPLCGRDMFYVRVTD